MPTTLVKIVHSGNFSSRLNLATTLRKQFGQNLRNILGGILGGSYKATVQASYAEASGVAASGTVTISGGSGTITATINGTACAVSWTTSDTNTASLLKTAINAEAALSGIVTATSALGVVTVTAADKHKMGNCITLAATGTGATASAAKLSGGVTPVYITYSYS